MPPMKKKEAPSKGFHLHPNSFAWTVKAITSDRLVSGCKPEFLIPVMCAQARTICQATK